MLGDAIQKEGGRMIICGGLMRVNKGTEVNGRAYLGEVRDRRRKRKVRVIKV